MKQTIDIKPLAKRLGKHNLAFSEREIWPEILQRISSGESLTRAVKCVGMEYWTAKYHLRHNESLKKQYYLALEERGDYLAEELVDLADEMPPTDLPTELINAWVNRQRLRIDARKWTSSKLRPKVWGDKIDVTITHTKISITQALKEAENRVLQDQSNIIDIEPASDTN